MTNKKLHRRVFIKGSLAGAGCLVLSSCDASSEPLSEGSADAGLSQPDAEANADGGLACQASQSDALGPFFEEGAPMRMQIANASEPGVRVALRVQILAEDCTTPLQDVDVEVWQADQNGVYYDAGDDFRLRGRLQSDSTGSFSIETIRPGNYELSGGVWRPAHIHFQFTKPGFETIATQIYFAGDPYLAPNDGCGGCGSDDTKRIVDYTLARDGSLAGDLEIVLARS